MDLKSNKLLAMFIFALILCMQVLPASSDEEDEPKSSLTLRPALRVGKLVSDFKFDANVIRPERWTLVDSISNLIMIEPEEGGEPACKTIVKVLANSKELLIGIWCHDLDPNQIVSFSKARDAELEEEDHVLIVLDTFRDGRSGYAFAVNPTGARFDGLIVEQGEDVNSDWDAIWEAQTCRDASGWCSVIRIPIKSLSFNRNLSSWGFNVQRRIQRLQETSRWAGANIDHEIFQTSQAGLLTDLPKFDLGKGLSITPASTGRAGRPAPGATTDYDGDFSLDVTQKLGSNLLSALTFNTDFAETEVDVRQVNVTRFPLYFPEKRSFFLEGADIFEFGVDLDEEKFVPFFSRRIGLLGLPGEDQSEVPINFGGKINGRIGNTNVGALVVNTRKMPDFAATEDLIFDVPQTTMGVIRIKQNIFKESTVGVLGTFGDQRGRSGAWSAGLDFTYRTSEFMDDKNFLAGIWGLYNDREDLSGDKSAYGFKVDYDSDLLAINLSSIHLGDGFDPSLGFMPRNNVNIWEFSSEYKPRPAWPWVRQMFHDVTLTAYTTPDNSDWESYEFTIKPVEWLLESGDAIEAGLVPYGDRPPEEFEVTDDVDIASGSYEWIQYMLGFKSAEKRKISTELVWETGDFYNGTLKTIEASLTLKPSALFALEVMAERNTGTIMALEDEQEPLLEKDFTEEVFGLRFQLNLSSDLQLSTLTQYDTQSRELGSNNKLRWTFHPLGDIFLVYNHNLIKTVRDNRWEFVSNELPVKIQYTLRF